MASALHGEALLRARLPQLEALAAELCADPAIAAEAAGILAGSWYAAPATTSGHQLIAAGLLIIAGPLDRDQLEHWVQVGYDRRIRAHQSYDPSRSSPPSAPRSARGTELL